MVATTLDTIREIRVTYTGKKSQKVSDYLSSTDVVMAFSLDDIFEHDLPLGTSAFPFMAASENVLARDWDTPEEDAAWAYLSKGK